MALFQSQLDRDLPELPSVVRLFVQRDLTGEYEILALNPDDGSQCAISITPAHQFVPDLIGLTNDAAQRYTAGCVIACGMKANDWQSWIDNFELAPEDLDFVWVYSEVYGDESDRIHAVNLLDSRELVVPPDQCMALIGDFIFFDSASFGQGGVYRMSASDWQSWLEPFEIAALDGETTAALSA